MMNNIYLYFVIGAAVLIFAFAAIITIIIVKSKKKANNTPVYNNQNLRRKKDNSEEKDLKKAIKETNKNIKTVNKKRRELGRVLTFAPMDDLIPIKRAVNKGNDGFEYQDDLGYFDVVKVVSFDYYSMDDDDLNMHAFYWDRFYRTTSIPLKRLSLNMPVDTTQQILYYKEVLSRTPNPLYREKIKKDIEELQYNFENRQTREYYMIFYTDSIDSLNNELLHIRASLEDRGYITLLPPLKKLEIFNKLCNPYTYKDMLTENFVDSSAA